MRQTGLSSLKCRLKSSFVSSVDNFWTELAISITEPYKTNSLKYKK